MQKGTQPAAAADVIRVELKKAFPGVRFRVMDRGVAINIRWMDGPKVQDVGASLHTPLRGYWGSKPGQVLGIAYNRVYSRKVIAATIERVCKKVHARVRYTPAMYLKGVETPEYLRALVKLELGKKSYRL